MITIGQVGLGHWGPNVLRNFVKLPGSRVKICCDVDEQALKRVRASYPQVETSNTSYTSSNSGSHTVALPASISSGDLLLAFFASDGADAPFVNWPAGWTEIFDDAGVGKQHF